MKKIIYSILLVLIGCGDSSVEPEPEITYKGSWVVVKFNINSVGELYWQDDIANSFNTSMFVYSNIRGHRGNVEGSDEHIYITLEPGKSKYRFPGKQGDSLYMAIYQVWGRYCMSREIDEVYIEMTTRCENIQPRHSRPFQNWFVSYKEVK